MIKTINQLVQKAKEIETKTIVVACAADEHVLEAVELARIENIVDGILVGKRHPLIQLKKRYCIVCILPKLKSCQSFNLNLTFLNSRSLSKNILRQTRRKNSDTPGM